MDWGNIIVQNVEKDAAGKVTGITAKLHLEGDFKKTKKKFTWLADTERVTPVQLLDFDFLITKKKLGERGRIKTQQGERKSQNSEFQGIRQ